MSWFDRFLNLILKVHGIPPATEERGLEVAFVPEPGHDPGYWVFTKQFDEECAATDLRSRLPTLTAQENDRLDAEWDALASPDNPFVAQARRLAESLTTLPTLPAVASGSVVSLLIDHSGSMRGRKISMAVASVCLAVRALREVGIRTEVLGFTTRSWRGGVSREKWAFGGRPTAPGRLCDLRHIVYRTADEADAHPPTTLKLMLREDILRENVDGEAVQWAANRLHASVASRKLLVVLSDGAPGDDSTRACNSEQFLEDHLRYVVRTIEASRDLGIAAIGIGHDASGYYSNATMVEEPDNLPAALMRVLDKWLAEGSAKPADSTVH